MQETLTTLPDASPYLLAAYLTALAVIGWLLVRRLRRLFRIRRELVELQRGMPSLSDALAPSDDTSDAS